MLRISLRLMSSGSKRFAQVLGVSEFCSLDELKTAYLQLVKKHHPDVGGDVKRFQEIQASYTAMNAMAHIERRKMSPDTPSFTKRRVNLAASKAWLMREDRRVVGYSEKRKHASGVNGNCFPFSMQHIFESGAKKGKFIGISNLWYTYKDLKKIGAVLKPGESEKGTRVPFLTVKWDPNVKDQLTKDRVYYNIQQTTDPVRNAAQMRAAAPLTPGQLEEKRSRLSIGERNMLGMARRVTNQAQHSILQEAAKKKNFTSLLWCTESEITSYGYALQPSAKGTLIPLTSQTGETTETLMFNAEESTDPNGLANMKIKLMKSGFKGTHLLWFQAPLMKAYAERMYSTPYWLTEKQISSFLPPLKVLPGETGVFDTTDSGYAVTYFNADQIVDGPVLIARHLISIGIAFEP